MLPCRKSWARCCRRWQVSSKRKFRWASTQKASCARFTRKANVARAKNASFRMTSKSSGKWQNWTCTKTNASSLATRCVFRNHRMSLVHTNTTLTHLAHTQHTQTRRSHTHTTHKRKKPLTYVPCCLLTSVVFFAPSAVHSHPFRLYDICTCKQKNKKQETNQKQNNTDNKAKKQKQKHKQKQNKKHSGRTAARCSALRVARFLPALFTLCSTRLMYCCTFLLLFLFFMPNVWLKE